ncbi:MAG: RnfABCDGE type electron transport complex subunit D, partial [Candidatus Omnitrophica bacterium]|nr:RnfABCDGE type electron transport complex subunit D [Candidatus Omnitrophota bacterium]
MPDKLIVDVSPHIHSHESTPRAMWVVFLALVPSAIAGVIIFGLPALKIIAVSVLSCVLAEAVIQKLTHKKITV